MTRVVIADDFDRMIEAMKGMISAEEDMTVEGVFTTFQQVLEEIVSLDHEVVLMNDYLYPTDSAIASRRLREMGIETPILVISMHRDATLIVESLEAGANGFILKEEFMEHLIGAIRTVCAGEQYLSPIAKSVLEMAESSN